MPASQPQSMNLGYGPRWFWPNESSVCFAKVPTCRKLSSFKTTECGWTISSWPELRGSKTSRRFTATTNSNEPPKAWKCRCRAPREILAKQRVPVHSSMVCPQPALLPKLSSGTSRVIRLLTKTCKHTQLCRATPPEHFRGDLGWKNAPHNATLLVN